MKKILTAVILLTSPYLSAAAKCPNVSGLYSIADSIVVEYEQTDCTFVKQFTRLVSPDGKISDRSNKADLDLKLDGSPSCNNMNLCDKATLLNNSIEFSSNYNQSVMTENHGRCAHRSFEILKNNNGDLEVIFHILKCNDGYSGTENKLFQKYQ